MLQGGVSGANSVATRRAERPKPQRRRKHREHRNRAWREWYHSPARKSRAYSSGGAPDVGGHSPDARARVSKGSTAFPDREPPTVSSGLEYGGGREALLKLLPTPPPQPAPWYEYPVYTGAYRAEPKEAPERPASAPPASPPRHGQRSRVHGREGAKLGYQGGEPPAYPSSRQHRRPNMDVPSRADGGGARVGGKRQPRHRASDGRNAGVHWASGVPSATDGSKRGLNDEWRCHGGRAREGNSSSMRHYAGVVGTDSGHRPYRSRRRAHQAWAHASPDVDADQDTYSDVVSWQGRY